MSPLIASRIDSSSSTTEIKGLIFEAGIFDGIWQR
jgi:hypothetical protein